MSRPTVRTAKVPAATVDLLRTTFGGAANAFQQLGVYDSVSYPVFVRAWKGETVQPAVVSAIELGWSRWYRRLVGKLGDSGEHDPVEGPGV